MSKKTLFIGAIASIIAINSVLADTTVTSKTYVDTTRQATIPVAGTNEDEPGETVVTYTNTAGVIGERGIFDDWYVDIVDNHLEDNLVTAGVLLDATDEIYSQMNYMGDQIEQATNLPETMVTYKICYQYQNGDCILWNLVDKHVYGKCSRSSDCDGYAIENDCPYGGDCMDGVCVCLGPR